MKTISGIFGASSLLLVLAAVGSEMFPGNAPNWMILLGIAVVCAVLSVVTFLQSKKSNG